MNLLTTNTAPISDLLIIEPKLFSDDRGYFFESYNHDAYNQLGINANFVQDNESCSKLGTLRGLHFQTGQHAQAKLIRVVHGQVYDVAVDLRKNSPSFGKAFGVEISAENKKQLFIPRGFAHGFVALSDNVILQYKCDNYYHHAAEAGIYFADPDLAVDWKLDESMLIVNERDRNFPTLQEYKSKL